ncbi:MAG: SRPBCC family protein [Actinomycetota bacterium]
MATVYRSTTIGASPEAIWSYLSDPTNWAEWDPDILAVEASEPGVAEGIEWPVKLSGGLRGTLRFDDVEPHREMEWEISALRGLMKGEGEFRFEPGDDANTIFHYEFEMEGALGSLFGRVAASQVVKAVETGLANIAAANQGA